MTDKQEPVVWVYRGPGQFYDVPPRSLTQSDYEALTPIAKRRVRESSEYYERQAAQASDSKTTDSRKTAKAGREGGDA